MRSLSFRNLETRNIIFVGSDPFQISDLQVIIRKIFTGAIK